MGDNVVNAASAIEDALAAASSKSDLPGALIRGGGEAHEAKALAVCAIVATCSMPASLLPGSGVCTKLSHLLFPDQ